MPRKRYGRAIEAVQALEGFNNKIKVAKRIGYGYRDEHYFFTLIRYMAIPSVRGSSHRNP